MDSMSNTSNMALHSQSLRLAQDVLGGGTNNPRSPNSALLPGQSAEKKHRLCSFSTASSEGVSQQTNSMASPKSDDFCSSSSHNFRHTTSAQLRSVLAVLLPKLPNGPPSTPQISEFQDQEAYSQLAEEEDYEKLLLKTEELETLVTGSLATIPEDRIPLESPQLLARSKMTTKEKFVRVITLFDNLAAKELAGVCEPVQQKVERVIETVGICLNHLSIGDEGLSTPVQDSQEKVKERFGFGTILRIPSIIKRALSCEEARISSPKTDVFNHSFDGLGCPPKNSLEINHSSVVHLRDQKDRNIFEDSPFFPGGKIANYSPEATAKIQASRIARGMFSLTLPLQLLCKESIEQQYKFYEALPSAYFSKFSCPSLVEIESKLSVPIGLFGLKDHTQQLSVWVASLVFQERLLELMLSVLPQSSNSDHLRFCRQYFEVSLQQTREYRRLGLILHLNSVDFGIYGRSSFQPET